MGIGRSVTVGWTALIAAGGLSYYLAKRGISEDLAAKREALQREAALRRQLQEQQSAEGDDKKGTYEAQETFRSIKGDRLTGFRR